MLNESCITQLWLCLIQTRLQHWNATEDDGILPIGPYPPCLRMADRALLAGYPRRAPRYQPIPINMINHEFESMLSYFVHELISHSWSLLKVSRWQKNTWNITIIQLQLSFSIVYVVASFTEGPSYSMLSMAWTGKQADSVDDYNHEAGFIKLPICVM